jgi:hypothetical protein
MMFGKNFVIAIFLIVLLAGCVSYVFDDNNTNEQNQTENKINATFFLPRFFELGNWKITDMSEPKISADGFASGARLRMNMMEGYGRYVGRIEIYEFNSTQNAGAYHDAIAMNKRNNEMQGITLSISASCYANYMEGNALERVNAYCVKKNIFFQVEITGDNTVYAKERLSTLAQQISVKVDALG